MALDQKFFKKSTTAATGLADQEEGLTAHLDANDVDSYDGDGSVWYDIAGHEVNIPLADKADNLQLHLNASDTTSYSGSGTTWTDISGNDRHGTINGGVESTYAKDIRGSFDFAQGTGDYVNVTHHADIKPSSNGVTYEFWITPEEISGTDTYLYTGSTSGYGSVYFRLESGVPNQTAYNSSNGVVTNISTGTALTAGSLHHVVLTISDITNPVTKLYQDGTLKATHTGSGTIHYLTEDLKIGRYTTGNANDFNGLIHAVRVYNTVLTAAEVGQNYRAGNTFSYSSIITSKHEATQGSLVTAPPVQGSLVTAPPVQGALHTSSIELSLDANSYSGSGNWSDTSGNNRHATISGAAYVNNNNSDYFEFAGSVNDYVKISDTALVQSGGTNFSVEAWIRRAGTGTYDYVASQTSDNGNSQNWLLRFNNNNTLGWYIYGSNNYMSTSSTYSANVWYHVVALVESNGTSRIYVDGVLVKSSSSGQSAGTQSYNTFIASLGDGSSATMGDTDIAQFRIYSTALTEAQINTNYDATKDLYQGLTSLELHLDANGYSSGNWSDTSGNNRHATLTGATYTDDNNSDYFDFNGSGNYAETSFSQNWASIPFSVEMWFNTDSRNNEYLWGLNDTAGNGVGASVRGSGNSYHLQFLGSGLIVSAGVVETNRWYHLVFTSDGTTKKAYLDGELKGTGTTTINSAANGKAFIFGRYGTHNGGYFNGKIAQVRIYNGAMATSQVKTNYDATKDLYQGITGLQLSLDANGYTSGSWSNTANSSYNATVSGATYTNDGNSDYFDFNGSNDYAEVTAYAGTDIGSGGFTFEAWALCEASSSVDTIVSNIGSDLHGYQLLANNTNVKLYIYAGSDPPIANVQASSSIVIGTWNHYSFTVSSTSSGAAVKLYINGSEAATGSLSGAYSGANTNFNIGKYPYAPTNRFFGGKIAQVRTYSGAMTAAQVKTNYDATKALYQNPTLKLHFDASDIDTTANTWTDKVSSLVLTKSGNSSYDAELGDFLQFEGGDYGNNSSVTQVKDSNGDYTVEFFFNFDTVSGNNGILGITQTSTLRGLVVLYNASYFEVYNYANGTHSASQYNTPTLSTLGITTSRWYHITIRIDNSTDIKIYVDGLLKATSTGNAGGTPWLSTSGLRIGSIQTLGYPVNGKVGNLKIYQGLLSDEQVAQNYLATKSQFPNGHSATINGSPTWGTYNLGGVTYNYFNLDGSSQYMTIPQNTILDFKSPTTMQLWIYKDNTTREWIIDKANGGSGSYGWQLLVTNASVFRFQVHNTSNGTAEADTSTTVSIETWYHIVVTGDGNNVYKIYLNGSLEGTGTLSGTLSVNTNGVTIGKYSLAGGYEYDGRIGMVKFHNRTFSATEVATAYNNTKGTYGIT
tara:strand:- start:37369 stop:41496 length:4128 start_codon:yes stop_codon:yes gene_type:complete